MMKIGRIWVCYPDSDRIIVDRLQDLEKYNLQVASSIDVMVSLSVEEFAVLRELVAQKKSLLP